jgi:two-component system, NtrC family, response regulator HydG
MASGLTVLIVDDDPSCLQLLQAILEEVGFAVTTADRPRAALQQTEAQPPDLLITDLRMPDMNGLELVRAVRRGAPEVCCVVITGFASDEIIAEAYQAGVSDLLLKPINVPEVQARVRNAAELVQLRREVRALRALRVIDRVEDVGSPSAPRARELSDLPVLPGSAGPVDGAGRDDVIHRLELLGALHRQGIITTFEFEEKKRLLLARL